MILVCAGSGSCLAVIDSFGAPSDLRWGAPIPDRGPLTRRPIEDLNLACDDVGTLLPGISRIGIRTSCFKTSSLAGTKCYLPRISVFTNLQLM